MMVPLNVILAYDFGGTKVGIAVADTSGKRLHYIRVKTSKQKAADLVRRVIHKGRELLNGMDAHLVSVGIAMCGVVCGNRIELIPNIPGMDRLDVRQMMYEDFQVPVKIENDVMAATLAELRKGALKGTDYGLYVNFGTGIAAGFTAGDKVMRGHNGAAGEIGYLLKNRDDAKGFQSGHAPFEEYAGGSGIAQRALAAFGQPLTAKELFEQSRANDETRCFVENIFQEMSFQVANLAICWNPERIVIGGGMAALPMLRESIIKKLRSCVPYPPEVVQSAFTGEASLYGAIELALSDV
ncbi:ROK family protein [Sporolactobacillus sp. THM7-7]|nr:ROK family protein [Sporolactobacillus sp. THM7-7]